RDDRGAGARACPVREAAVVRGTAPPVRRGDRRRERPAPRELPAGVHAPRPHRRGVAPDRTRGGAVVTHRVVVVGGGFGGLPACRRLGGHDGVRVTLLDRRNHHLFQPLLYQVATGILSSGQIAPPLRQILRRHRNVDVVLAEVDGFDLDRRVVRAKNPFREPIEVPYDSLIVAAGVTQSYF